MTHDEDPHDFTDRRDDVHTSEWDYLRKRRALQTGAWLLPPVRSDNLWGVCLSGGGIRSATFSLGVLQTLIASNALRRFDYMSTVSGGGYIGTCLTSLLSPAAPVESTGDAEPEILGVEPENSPFVGLNALDPLVDVETKPRMSVRHQMHHLRTHGEYLLPQGSGALTRDTQRAVGTIVSGILHHATLFLLALVALVSATMLVVLPFDPAGRIIPWPEIEQHGSDTTPRDAVGDADADADATSTSTSTARDDVPDADASLGAELRAWWSERVVTPLAPIVDPARRKATVHGVPFDEVLLLAALAGALWCLGWIVAACRLTRRPHAELSLPDRDTRSGFDGQDAREWTFTAWFNGLSVVLTTLATWYVARVLGNDWTRLHDADDLEASPAPVAFLLPVAIALGGLAASFVVVNLLRSWDHPGRARRSLLATIQGASVYGLVGALAAPFVLSLLFSFDTDSFPWGKLGAGLASLVGARWITWLDRRDPAAIPPRWRSHLLTASVLLVLAVTFSLTADLLIAHFPVRPEHHFVARRLDDAVWTLGLSLLALVVLGLAFDSNMLSPHYFYRDRLSEAYLYTSAAVNRGKQSTLQGRPRYPLRDSESLRLHEIGEHNGRGPYHILVAALNLRGSRELQRKTMLSAHFEFAKEWTGSEVTGWVRTRHYRDGETKLARAMTISAAAAGSATGFHTTAASAFVLTLFNARLGYWMENPWTYGPGRSPSLLAKLLGRWTFWPYYLGCELLGRLTARSPLVNLSDGGHTGDNLGLLPLLQRRCAVVLVVDAESDGRHAFQSFNDALRMALIEEDIEVSIDLSPLRLGADGRCEQSWQLGTIHYPESEGRPAWSGSLVYLKASLSGGPPVHVENYAAGHPGFPHDSTADQFFDDAQFESYRALGQHVARQATPSLQRLLEREALAGGTG